MTADRIALVSTMAIACLGCASAAAPAPAADRAAAAPARPAAATRATQFLTVRGPDELDCPAELEGARGSGDPALLFLTEVKCRVHPAWKCRESCKGDELLVTHVAVRLGRDGGLLDARVLQPSVRSDFDTMSVAAVTSGAPFSAPPAPLLDTAGAAAFNVELACDCVRLRPRR